MESACDICGCTRTNLVDGYYYCAECGTQDTNARETRVEFVTLSEGVFGMASRKKIKVIPQANQEEMTDDWYKWHCLNFLLQGLANELVELGAEPSFKTKLLWVWTRYMKKYQNLADFGLPPNEEDEREEDKEKTGPEDDIEDDENEAINENYFSDEEDDEEITRKHKKFEKPNMKKINMCLVVTILYVALNLDKSHIQLTHLIRFITEGRLPLTHWQKYVPEEMYPKKLVYCLLYNRQWILYSYHNILYLGLQMFRELDLGNPIVPDLRLLLDQYMQELCLPKDMKPLVLSLMHYRSFDYLDINVKFYKTGRLPSYELYVISHILCAMKICFGIDGDYEGRLSDAVEKINEIESHPKSYNSEPTARFFSFREWCKYIQFRKSVLKAQTLYLGSPHYSDMNDYVTFEHLNEKADYKKTFKDEITRDIINKLPDVDVNVIPKSEFPVTTTPHTAYTRVIIDHQQDPTVKQLLSEDFTQYSLKYITEDMFLVDPDSTNPKNILTGVSSQHGTKETGEDYRSFKNWAKTRFGKKNIYVKDCDNHNWLKTQRPKHTPKTRKKTNGSIDENENNDPESEVDSVITDEIVNDLSCITDINGFVEKAYESDSEKTILLTEDNKILNDLNSIIEKEIDEKRQNENERCKDFHLLKIPEEAEDENIFDDKFEDLDIKKEEAEDPEYNEPMPETQAENEAFELPNILRSNPFNQEYHTMGRDSDESSDDSIHLKPETLDRSKAIKELVINACNKYKVSLPGHYVYQRKRKTYIKKPRTGPVSRAKVLGLTTQKINDIIADYHKKVEQDIFFQMSNMVQSAITDFNQNKDVEQMETDESPIDNDTPELDMQNVDEMNNIHTLNDTTQNIDLDNTADGEYTLFDEESDGETHAEELLPKKNPEYDEATHHISQLYIKPADDASTIAPELKLNPNLFKIIDKTIEDEKGGKPPSPEVEEDYDSEEDMSLSMLQELKLFREQLTKQAQCTNEKKLKPLIKNPILPYGYWVRHYLFTHCHNGYNQRFVTEIYDAFPSTFKLVIDECSDVVGYPVYNVYKSLHRVESCIKHKYVQRKRFVPSYFEKETKRFRRSKDML